MEQTRPGTDNPDFNNPYLKNQLIAYIGNKRRLLDFLGEVFTELENRCGCAGVGINSRQSGARALRFGDCFAGSGSVSRLAKAMGFSVASNDWEFYSNIINTAHIAMSKGDTDALFADVSGGGGLAGLLDELNSPGQPDESERYISRYYAPATTNEADYRYERLFYTHENALFIDAVRSRIEQWFPGWDLTEADFNRKCALLAPLLYQAATHANTNGVFKAYHKGFGGHGGDALTRIMAPMRLQMPLLAEALPGRRYEVESRDAADFAAGYSGERGFDICYLDPPYNQHQYGSNYFMLNTIARWDKPPVSMGRGEDGRLDVKAGIRGDWTDTRSGFCYAKTAPEELRRLLDNIDARYIVLSYNTEGIIPFDELFDILARYGRVEIFCRDYIIYRGGKQSIGRANRNVEFQLVLSRSEKPVSGDREAVDKILKIRSIVSLMNESFVPGRIAEHFRCRGNVVELFHGRPELAAETYALYRFVTFPEAAVLHKLSAVEVDALLAGLEFCRCSDRLEEAGVLMEMIRGCSVETEGFNAAAYRKLWAALFNVVRKFAFRKYRDTFEEMFESLLNLLEQEKAAGKPGNWNVVDKKTAELRRVADLRVRG